MRSTYGSRKIKLFIQGSYANNTNVRTQSDVDIAVVQEEIFQTVYREGVSDRNYNFSTAKPAEKSFKDEVEECLKDKLVRMLNEKINLLRFMEIHIEKMLIPYLAEDIVIIVKIFTTTKIIILEGL